MTHRKSPHMIEPTDTEKRLVAQYLIGYAAALQYIPQEWIERTVRATAAVHGHQHAALMLRGDHREPIEPAMVAELRHELAAAYVTAVIYRGMTNPSIETCMAMALQIRESVEA